MMRLSLKSILKSILLFLLIIANTSATELPHFEIGKTVIKIPIAKGVSMEDAIDSLLLRANMLNVKLVGHQPLSKEYKALKLKNTRRTEIFQFCDARIAKDMIEYDISFAAYMPCRITLVEDQQGQAWFVMMDLDIFIQAAHLPPDLQKKAVKIRDNLMAIVKAGANGEL